MKTKYNIDNVDNNVQIFIDDSIMTSSAENCYKFYSHMKNTSNTFLFSCIVAGKNSSIISDETKGCVFIDSRWYDFDFNTTNGMSVLNEISFNLKDKERTINLRNFNSDDTIEIIDTSERIVLKQKNYKINNSTEDVGIVKSTTEEDYQVVHRLRTLKSISPCIKILDDGETISLNYNHENCIPTQNVYFYKLIRFQNNGSVWEQVPVEDWESIWPSENDLNISEYIISKQHLNTEWNYNSLKTYTIFEEDFIYNHKNIKGQLQLKNINEIIPKVNYAERIIQYSSSFVDINEHIDNDEIDYNTLEVKFNKFIETEFLDETALPPIPPEIL